MALEQAWGAEVPRNARLLRAIAQATEIIQNGIRWLYTVFAPGLADQAFSSIPGHAAYSNRFAAYKGTAFRRGLLGATYPISLYAMIAGQWPHAGLSIPGGVGREPDSQTLSRAAALLERFQMEWLEKALLHTSAKDFLDLKTVDDLMIWIDSGGRDSNSDLASLLRAALDADFHNLGAGNRRFLTYGAFQTEGQEGLPVSPETHLDQVFVPGVFIDDEEIQALNPEHLSACVQNLDFNSLNYQGKGVEMGSLSRMMALGTSRPEGKLISHLFQSFGSSVFVRALARIQEIVLFHRAIGEWISLIDPDAPWRLPVEERSGWGLGLTEAPRGGLAHFVLLEEGRIADYRILPPTVMNLFSGTASPSGSPLAGAINGMELSPEELATKAGVIARSFDACLSCKIRLLKNPSGGLIASLEA